MLTCRWCGLRPTDEFVLVEAAGPCAISTTNAVRLGEERWWHRLGCGRPFVVATMPTPRPVAATEAAPPTAGPSSPGPEVAPERAVADLAPHGVAAADDSVAPSGGGAAVG